MSTNRTAIVWFLFLLVTLETLFSVPLLGWELALGNSRVSGSWFAIAAAVVICLIVWGWIDRWRGAVRSLSEGLSRVSGAQLFWVCFAVGTLLRILWFLAYPAPQHSDQLAYFGLAQTLVQRHSYSISGSLAYWPPGYPFFLSLWFLVFGFKTWLPLLVNIFLFAASLLVVKELSRRIGGPAAASLSVILLTFWPTMIMTAGMASKEMLVLPLMVAALLAFDSAQNNVWTAKRILLTVVTGILVAAASFTQPSLMLFPSVLIAFAWFRREHFASAIMRLAIVCIAMGLVILPWTLRNHRVLGAWVPISTNGGEVFYRANNPLATGGYTPVGEHNLSSLDEVQQGKVGFQLGKEWIRTHPAQFVALCLRKEVLFLGDDAQGAFETLKRGLNIGGSRYMAWKGIADLYWWALWTGILLLLLIRFRTPLSANPLLAAVMLGILYLFAIHSVFESGAKYHEPLMGLLAVLGGQLVARQEE